jgi:bla regulator protein BlaR1
MLTNTALTIFEQLNREILFLVFLCDVLFKSLLLVVLVNYLNRRFLQTTSGGNKHLLWLSSFFCVAAMPLLPELFQRLAEEGSLLRGASLIIFSVAPDTLIPLMSDSIAAAGRIYIWQTIYLTIVSYLLLKLLCSVLRMQLISKSADYTQTEALSCLLLDLCTQMKLKRVVNIGFSQQIDSPLSFGLRHPKIILPDRARTWTDSVLTSVVTHELSHIRRFDWLTTLVCYFLASLNWFNPLVWLIFRRIKKESEFICDDAVLKNDKSPVVFAEELLLVARQAVKQYKTELFAQSMIDSEGIYSRLKNILDEKPRSKSMRWVSIPLLVLFTSAVFTASGSTKILSIGSRDVIEESRVIYSEQPIYPESAMGAGIEGWVLLNFDVDRYGVVAPSSIKVMEAHPLHVFDEVSISTIGKFKFSARRINGEAVSSDDSKYIFRFKLDYLTIFDPIAITM